MRCLFVLIVVAATVANAQVRFDAGIGIVVPSASTSFRSLPGFPSCCPEFTSGSGTGLSAGLGVDVPIVGNLLASVRLGTADLGHTLTTREQISVLVDGNDAAANVSHVMALTQQAYTADVLLGVRMNRVTLRAGLGYMVRGNATLRSEETIEDPAGATFLDTGSPVRNQRSGQLPEQRTSSVQLGLSIALSFPLDPEHRWQLSPEVGMSFPIQSITSATSWMVTIPSASIRCSWSPFGTTPQSEANTMAEESVAASEVNPEQDDAPITSASTVVLDIIGDPTVAIDEVEVETFLPVLPYVFFENDMATLPERYTRLIREPLPTASELPDRFHHRILPLIAKRMQEFPDATITIVGAISARERDQALARTRASAVATMLRDSFGIDGRRISILDRTLPENPTRAGGDEAVMADDENSRVEIHADDHRLLLPYHVQDTLVQMTPPQLQIMAHTPALGGLTGWTLSVNDAELRSSDQAFTRPVTFSPTPSMVRSLLASGEIRIHVDGDVEHKSTEQQKTIPIVAQRLFSKRTVMQNDSIVEEFGLVIFPYNSATLTSMHQYVLDMVRRKIGTKARLTVEGRTDILGAEDANLELSRQRAQAVADQLGGIATVIGRGEPTRSTPQTLPEQRMLERIVRIRAMVPTSP